MTTSIDTVWSVLKTGDREKISSSFKNKTTKQNASVLEVLAHALRGAIIATPGNELFVADYASIEVRVLLWLAEDEDHLDMLRRGEDPYLDMAQKVYHYPCTKADNPMERALGKVAVLGLGYQMGAPKFVVSAKTMGGVEIDEDFSRVVVETYRTEYWRVKQMWYDTEAAAIQAVRLSRPVDVGYVSYCMDPTRRFLFAELPSGRKLAYPFPRVSMEETSWGKQKETLTFMGVDSYTRQWKRQKTYGGMLVENNTQATARDLLVHSMQQLEFSEVYTPILSVHDEVIAEAPIGTGSVEEFVAIVQQLPDWADGMPVEAEAWKGLRYHK